MNISKNARNGLIAAILMAPAFVGATSYEGSASAQPADADCGGAVEQTRADSGGEPTPAVADVRQSNAAGESERAARDKQAAMLREEGQP